MADMGSWRAAMRVSNRGVPRVSSMLIKACIPHNITNFAGLIWTASLRITGSQLGEGKQHIL